mmetsp:Transcript_84162/g.225013  ORF Transcript_84162/g.225013 Transcript_84162/m.225013 type:complete len:236 (+) Transcript_84162:1027-1734(+)
MSSANTGILHPKSTPPCCATATCPTRGRPRSRSSPRICSATLALRPWRIRCRAGFWSPRPTTKLICWARAKSPSLNCDRRRRRPRPCRCLWTRSRQRAKVKPLRTSAGQVLPGRMRCEISWNDPRRRASRRTYCPRKSNRTRPCCSSSGCCVAGPCRTRCSRGRRSAWTSSTSCARRRGGRRLLAQPRRSSGPWPGSRSGPWKVCWSPCKDRCWPPCWTSSARSCSVSKSNVASQ